MGEHGLHYLLVVAAVVLYARPLLSSKCPKGSWVRGMIALLLAGFVLLAHTGPHSSTMMAMGGGHADHPCCMVQGMATEPSIGEPPAEVALARYVSREGRADQSPEYTGEIVSRGPPEEKVP